MPFQSIYELDGQPVVYTPDAAVMVGIQFCEAEKIIRFIVCDIFPGDLFVPFEPLRMKIGEFVIPMIEHRFLIPPPVIACNRRHNDIGEWICDNPERSYDRVIILDKIDRGNSE
jgi:hypothetical protein